VATKINWGSADAAFTSLVRLGSGAVMARACDNFFDYDLPRARAVMRAFAPVLPRGVPEHEEQLGVPVPEPPWFARIPRTISATNQDGDGVESADRAADRPVVPGGVCDFGRNASTPRLGYGRQLGSNVQQWRTVHIGTPL
jgi:hypothetical protein